MPPNIVFITCHDLGHHLNCYGWHTVNSPALDRLAAEGVLFEKSFCTAPQCSPSRAALHTGRHAHSNGMMGLAHDPFNWRLHPGEKHLAQRLQAAGYATALIGVQHLTAGPTARELGYDEVIAGRRASDQVGPAAQQWLAQVGTQPFYLEVGFFEPHRAYASGDDSSKGVEIPPYIPDTPAAQQDFAALQGSIKAMDEGVGMILDALDANDLRENTWVIFAADHGIAMPRAKCTLYDPGIEAALLMRWPQGGVSGGKRLTPIVSHVDVVPTVLEALELPLPDNLHGHSLWPLLQGSETPPNEAVFVEKTFHTAYEPMRGIRTKRYKLIVNLDADLAINVPTDIQASPIYPTMFDQISSKRPQIELYDLQTDPLEQNNLAGQPEVADVEADLKQWLLEWMQATDDPILKGPVPSPYYFKALDQLG
ncbi:MAG: sulfatase, partial [Anaerolineae bacterium]|nr:sulfatase [Anaerolineae bacterium]